MCADPLYLEREGACATLVLNRPDKLNALNETMWLSLPHMLDEAARDPAIRVLVVKGANHTFAAGADISEFENVYATPERADAYSKAIGDGLDALAAFPKPTLALIEGACIGGGCALALACDLRFAAQGAKFGVTPAKLGLVYPFNDLRRLMQTVGASTAKDLLYTGRLVDAETAKQMGLVNTLHPAAEIEQAVQDHVRQILNASSHTARITKAMASRIENGQSVECDLTRHMFKDAFSSPDFQEGYRAFLDKRTPRFGDT